MVFGFGASDSDDRNGTKKYRFSKEGFGTITSRGMQGKIEGILLDNKDEPLKAAGIILDKFKSREDQAVLFASPTIQDVVFHGSGTSKGPVTYLLEEATKQQGEDATKAMAHRYQRLVDGAKRAEETAEILREDPKQNKKYVLNIMNKPMTGPDIKQWIDGKVDWAVRHRKAMDEAVNIIDTFSQPENMKVLQGSPRVRFIVLGAHGDRGSIGFLLDAAKKTIATDDTVKQERLQGLEERFGDMVNEARGIKTKPVAGEMPKPPAADDEKPKAHMPDPAKAPAAAKAVAEQVVDDVVEQTSAPGDKPFRLRVFRGDEEPSRGGRGGNK